LVDADQSVNKETHEVVKSFVGFSALEGTRTPNLLIRSQMLYPLSYKREWDCQSLTYFGEESNYRFSSILSGKVSSRIILSQPKELKQQ
jgi:hypothetical protein